MNNDKHLELLNKLSKLLRAYEILSTKKDLTPFEEAVLQRVSVGVEICLDTLSAMDELWKVYEETETQRPEVTVVTKPQEKPAPKKQSNSDDGLALGVGMAAGGIFDYLQSPDNVEKVENSDSRQIEALSDEELEALESEVQQPDIEELEELRRQDHEAALQEEYVPQEWPEDEHINFLETQEVVDTATVMETPELDPRIEGERVDLEVRLQQLTQDQQIDLRDSLERVDILDEVEAYGDALAEVSDFDGGMF